MPIFPHAKYHNVQDRLRGCCERHHATKFSFSFFHRRLEISFSLNAVNICLRDVQRLEEMLTCGEVITFPLQRWHAAFICPKEMDIFKAGRTLASSVDDAFVEGARDAA